MGGCAGDRLVGGDGEARQSDPGGNRAASKITRELVPAQSLTVNNYVLRDAAELVNALRHHPAAQQALVEWHQRRNGTKVIEHAAAD